MRRGAVGVAVMCLLLTVTDSVAAKRGLGQQTISVAASPSRVQSGRQVTLSGTVHGGVLPAQVQLYSRPYPYKTPHLAGTTTTAPDGSYSFTQRPDRNTRYQVRVVGTQATARVQVDVLARVIVREKAIPLGRAKIVIVLFHPFGLKWRHGHVRWWFATASHGFRRGPKTEARRVGPHKIQLVIKQTLPAGSFRWRACFHAPGARALTDPHPPPGCRGQGFTGHGRLPQGFPGPRRIAQAESYLQHRQGTHALAVVDSEGRISGYNLNRQFITGSVVKAMLLVAYLRRLDRMGQHHVDSYSNSFLYPMIHVSDNNAATHCWDIVGNAGLYEVAHAAGMTHFRVDTGASWGSEWGAALITARDQAKFFFEMDSLIPREFVHYARYLLSHIASYESWGIPAVARPRGYRVFWKAGWRPSPHVYLVHQIARLEKGHERFAIAVMTDGDPDMGYGIASIEGATRALLH